MVTTVPLPEAMPWLAGSPGATNDDLPTGLTSDEARRRLKKFGPNAMPDTALDPLRMAIEKFWAPVPWMLEAAVVLELALGNMSRPGLSCASGIQCRTRTVAGEPRPGHPCRAEVAAGA